MPHSQAAEIAPPDARLEHEAIAFFRSVNTRHRSPKIYLMPNICGWISACLLEALEERYEPLELSEVAA